ncbi:ATP synthase F1 subunit epsilon [Horticoccus luteus]|uniref:ATP synthase epsilon chain n=1 Tax=Horticoccus luteus TaxID=2862869 RepID=A0A8F9TWV1_9BACT|nr:ATP synthase F1 subunit epsilon [Horticoccus luteus]QYM79022.1 ATP synthase F1 subunit epsilon [Horticoccus luteus]
MPLTLDIVTPEARVYSDTIDTVVLPTVAGEVGILPGHIPLLTRVAHGELRVTKNGHTALLAVGDGFAQIDGDRVQVLAESAIAEDKIDANAVEQAMRRAEEALAAAQHLDPAEVERLEGVVRFAVVQLGLKRRRT